MRLVKIVSSLMVLVLVAGPMFGADEEKEKVPTAKDQEKAEAVIKDLFKAEFAKLKAADRLDLSNKLHEQGLETKDDPASRYVLLRLSLDLAAQAGDLAQAMKVADDMAHHFAVNGAELKVGVFEKLAPAVKAADENKELTEKVLQAVNEAIMADDFDTGDRLVKVADATAKKSKNVTLVSSVAARGKEITRLRTEFAKVKEALATLEKKPTDAEANTVAGKYYSFIKGDWDKGLILLAQGNDAKVKILAEKDAAGPGTPQEQMEVADGWYELANVSGTDATTKLQLQLRALSFYERCLEGLTGLTKTKVQKRMTELDKAVGPRRDHRALFEAIRAAVKNEKNPKARETKDSPLIGFTIGADWREVLQDGAVLIGFDVGISKNPFNKEVPVSLKAIYLTPRGEKYGDLIGNKSEKTVTLKAPPGHAVSAINIHQPLGIEGVSLTFMRIGPNNGLMKGESSTSDWAATKVEKPRVTSGDGGVAVGIFGKKGGGGEPCAVGLVLLPTNKK